MNIVFFDVETRGTFDEVGGRHNIRMLGLSAAVTYSTADGAFHHYSEEPVDDLIAELKAADRVAGSHVSRGWRFDAGLVSPLPDWTSLST